MDDDYDDAAMERRGRHDSTAAAAGFIAELHLNNIMTLLARLQKTDKFLTSRRTVRELIFNVSS